MSTYSGDAQIVDVITASLSVENVSGSDSYTVPAGQFAMVQLISYSTANHNGSASTASISMGGVLIDAATNGGPDVSGDWKTYPDFMLLNEGDSVSVTNQIFNGVEDVFATFRLRLFNKP